VSDKDRQSRQTSTSHKASTRGRRGGKTTAPRRGSCQAIKSAENTILGSSEEAGINEVSVEECVTATRHLTRGLDTVAHSAMEETTSTGHGTKTRKGWKTGTVKISVDRSRSRESDTHSDAHSVMSNVSRVSRASRTSNANGTRRTSNTGTVMTGRGVCNRKRNGIAELRHTPDKTDGEQCQTSSAKLRAEFEEFYDSEGCNTDVLNPVARTKRGRKPKSSEANESQNLNVEVDLVTEMVLNTNVAPRSTRTKPGRKGKAFDQQPMDNVQVPEPGKKQQTSKTRVSEINQAEERPATAVPAKRGRKPKISGKTKSQESFLSDPEDMTAVPTIRAKRSRKPQGSETAESQESVQTAQSDKTPESQPGKSDRQRAARAKRGRKLRTSELVGSLEHALEDHAPENHAHSAGKNTWGRRPKGSKNPEEQTSSSEVTEPVLAIPTVKPMKGKPGRKMKSVAPDPMVIPSAENSAIMETDVGTSGGTAKPSTSKRHTAKPRIEKVVVTQNGEQTLRGSSVTVPGIIVTEAQTPAALTTG